MALIYIVEDEPDIREIESIALRNSNHIVMGFERSIDFFVKVKENIPDLIILDVMLPGESGYSILHRLRSIPSTRSLPVIMVTAKTEEIDVIRGFDDGADDYLCKPFSVLELVSRVKAVLRRTQSSTVMKSHPLCLGNITLDDDRRVVTESGNVVDLTFKEYELLRFLMENPDVVLSREKIMQHVWEVNSAVESRTVDMHIKTLRHKLGDSGKQIRTVRNVGYAIGATSTKQ